MGGIPSFTVKKTIEDAAKMSNIIQLNSMIKVMKLDSMINFGA
ncbi:MAG: hypothetical protein R8K49_05400 [Mariprofundaceae bacterium]